MSNEERAPGADSPTPGMRKSRVRQALGGSLPLLALVLLAALLVVLRWQLLPPTPVVLDLGNPASSASHFFNVEHSPEYAFRWSRDMSAVSVPAVAASEVLSITLNPARPGAEPAPTVRVLANGRTQASFAGGPGWQTYRVNVGPGLGPETRVVLESDTFYPGAGDRRRLGVAVASVEVRAGANRFGLLLPPLLWLVLAGAVPLLAMAIGSLCGMAQRRRLLLVGIASLVPVFWSVVVPVWWALPSFGWGVGLLSGASALRCGYGALDKLIWLRRLAGSRWELPAVGLLAAVLSVGATWPLVSRLGDSLPGWPGDNFAFLYKLWWFRTAIVEQHRWPFFDPGSYAPFGFNLGQGEPTLANTLPGVVLGTFTNDVVAYNLLALASFVASAIGGYLLVRELTGSKLAALVGGIAFAFCPFRLSQFAGHLQLLGTGWIALAFYFLERLLRGGGLKHGAYLGIALGLAALSAWYYAYMVALGLGLYLLFRGLALRRSIRWGGLARGLAAGAVLFLVLASPVAIPSLQLWAEGDLSHSAKAADEHSAAPLDYAVPNPLQPVWGQVGMTAHAEQNVIESALYVGVVLAVVAVGGWWLSRRERRRQTSGRLWLPWLGLAVVCAILSLGLTLHDANGQVKLNGSAITMPGQLLYNWLPLYSSMRAFARFGILVTLAVVSLAGLGWAAWLRSGPAVVRMRPVFASVAVIVLVLVDFWSGPYAWGTTEVQIGPMADYVAKLPPGAVMQMPLAASQSGPALYQHVFYGKPIAYGYETFEPPQWASARPALEDFPSDKCLDVLKQWGVRYIVVSANAYGADWPGMLQQLQSLPRLRFLSSFREQPTWNVDPGVLDARPDMQEYAQPDSPAVFELIR